MLRVDLGQLRREGSVSVEASEPADSELWNDSDFVWDGEVDFALTASVAGTGEIVVRGRVQGRLNQECRRCLEPVGTAVEEDLTIVFVERDGEASEGDEYGFDGSATDIELGEAVREEMILTIDPYVVCEPDCKGLCPRCGTALNEGPCDCAETGTDPRWDALRALKDE